MKKIKSTAVIYDIVAESMADLSEPITVAELMDKPAVRAAAIEKFGTDVQIATNKLSDMLGFMWRRGVLDRYNAHSSNTMARFAYTLKEASVQHAKPITTPKRPDAVVVTENNDGSVNIEFAHFSMVIHPKHK